MKKTISIILLLCFLLSFSIISSANNGANNEAESYLQTIAYDNQPEITALSGYLLEATTGKVLFMKNEFNAYSPASVTKIMTLLLVCEAIENGQISITDTVTVSKNAASMGGSQVFLEEGERFSVEELIKCTVIASGNDAAVALAEFTAGSEEGFVKMMNKRAAELGLRATAFENVTGLDDTTTNHYSCAADIGTMSRELIKHDIILKYSSMWQDSIRNGEFILTNTNRLVRFYDGCNGLKTGSTDKAGFCVSATAKRGNMQLIAVIMGAESSAVRNEEARALLDYGFANFALYERGEEYLENIPVIRGKKDNAPIYSAPFSLVVDKSRLSDVELVYEIPEYISAPISSGQKLGQIIYQIDGEQIGKSEIYASEAVEAIKIGGLWLRIVKRIICG